MISASSDLLAHRVVVLFRGRMVEEGPRSRFHAPRHRYTQLLLAFRPGDEREEERLKPNWPWEQDVAATEGGGDGGCLPRPLSLSASTLCAGRGQPAVRLGRPARCVNPG